MKEHQHLIKTKWGFSCYAMLSAPLNQITKKQFLVVAIQVLNDLKWKLQYVSPSGILATTKMSLSSWGEEITIKIVDESIIIRCECTGSQMYDWGKNRKRIISFLSSFDSLLNTIDNKTIEKEYNELNKEFPPSDQDILLAPPLKGLGKLKSFFSFFSPRKGYFATPIIIDINIMIFVLMILSGVHLLLPGNEELINWGANFKPLTLDGEWWRLITCCFIHIGIVHLLVNMYALLYIGFLLEPRIGSVRFGVAYILSGISGSILSLWWNDITISAGASGAIFGMYGVFLALLLTNEIEKNSRKSLLISMAVFLSYNLLYGLKSGIDNAAHIGGLVGGIIIGFAFYPSIINPNSLRLKIIIPVALSGLFIIITSIIYFGTPNSLKDYEDLMKQFATNEKLALELYTMPSNSTKEDLLYEIKDRGLYYWNENIDILNKVETLKGLPDEIMTRNAVIRQYCDLRIEAYKFIYNAVNEETNLYDSLIMEKNKEIEHVLSLLEE